MLHLIYFVFKYFPFPCSVYKYKLILLSIQTLVAEIENADVEAFTEVLDNNKKL